MKNFTQTITTVFLLAATALLFGAYYKRDKKAFEKIRKKEEEESNGSDVIHSPAQQIQTTPTVQVNGTSNLTTSL